MDLWKISYREHTNRNLFQKQGNILQFFEPAALVQTGSYSQTDTQEKHSIFLKLQLYLLHWSKFGGMFRDLPALPCAYVESIKQEQLSFLPFLYIQGRPEAASEAAGGPPEQASVTTAWHRLSQKQQTGITGVEEGWKRVGSKEWVGESGFNPAAWVQWANWVLEA